MDQFIFASFPTSTIGMKWACWKYRRHGTMQGHEYPYYYVTCTNIIYYWSSNKLQIDKAGEKVLLSVNYQVNLTARGLWREVIVVVYLTLLTDPLRIQPWSQNRCKHDTSSSSSSNSVLCLKAEQRGPPLNKSLERGIIKKVLQHTTQYYTVYYIILYYSL